MYDLKMAELAIGDKLAEVTDLVVA